MLYSGHEEENAPHTEGVVLLLSHQAYNALIGCEALGPRMMHASFRIGWSVEWGFGERLEETPSLGQVHAESD